MGRLFQYNRFGVKDAAKEDAKKDNHTADKHKSKTPVTATKSPAYSAIYADYNAAAYDAEADTAVKTTRNLSDFAIKKCQQWSNRLLTTTAAGDYCPSHCTSTASTVTSGYHSRQEELQQSTASRTYKMYDCMKDFLRRKLFQQHNGGGGVGVGSSSQLKHEILIEEQKDAQEADATSDYDEHDMLDSTYNGDDEDVTDCSCSYASDTEEVAEYSAVRVTKANGTPQKSILSLNCWQSSNHSDTSSCSEDDDSSLAADESDAGISDCCQLLASGGEGEKPLKRNRNRNRTRSQTPNKSQKSRYNTDNDSEIEEELLANSWYQPLISSKATLECLQHATPGSFLVRRTRRSFELCLRAEKKVKYFTVLHTSQDVYKLKGAKKQFSTLKALVTHHSLMAEQLPLTLDLPREKHLVKRELMRYEDDFEPLESLQLLGILKSLQAKHFEL